MKIINHGGSGGGGGAVNDVTASLPLTSTGGATPNIAINTIYYDVGAGKPYGTVAAAIAAASGAGATKAANRYNDTAALVEDIALPKGMSLQSLVTNGQPTQTLSTHIASAAGTGTSTVVGFIITNNGAQEICTANAITNISFTNNIFGQTVDLPILTATAGSNVNFIESTFVGAGIATDVGLHISGGNVSILRCSTLAIASELFANINTGALTAADSTIRGNVTCPSGTLSIRGSLVSATVGSALNLTTGTPVDLVDVEISSNVGGTNAIVGTSTIKYKNLSFINTQLGVDNTITWVPYPTVVNTIAVADAKFAFTGGNYEYGIENSGINAFGWNAPTNTGFKWLINAGQVLQMTEFGTRLTTNPLIGSYVPAEKIEVSGNVNLPNAEASNVWWDLSHEQIFAGGGIPIELQREAKINAPTYSAAAAQTITFAATHGISGPPDAGANMTISGTCGYYSGSRLLSADTSVSFLADLNGISLGKGAVGVITGFAAIASGGTVNLGNQAATLSIGCSAYFPSLVYSSITATRTISKLATLYVGGAPTFAGTVAVTEGPYSALFDSGTVRIDGRINKGRFTGTPCTATQVLPSDGCGGTLTGNTNIDFIDTTGWTSWSDTIINFTGTPTINHNTGGAPGGTAAILCEGSANIVVTAGSYVKFLYNGTNWIASPWMTP